ncbi:MAG: hypothetical protein ACHP7J_00990 [Terriglobales bacterium]
MKRTTFLTAFASLLALVSLLGCATTNKLQSIDLTANGTSGTVEVKGAGGTLQLLAIGNYSNGTSRDLTGKVTYNLTVSAAPDNKDFQGNTLPAPPLDLTVNATGQLTAVAPFVCTFDASNLITGSYTVVVSMNGMSSQPMYIPVASAAGNGPGGACGP